jgi:TetR/AcrR family transcriptional regulator, cholesterol catabolism regulator
MAQASPIHADLGPDLPDYKRARRAQIVQAALAALKDHDYDQIQMRDVAERAGVALGTLYRYFSSKEHVYAAVLMEWAQPVFVAAEPDSQPAELRLRTKVRAIVASFERRPGFFRVCQLLQNSADPNTQQIMQQFADTAVRTLANDFAALGEPAASDTAWMLWGIINTLLSGTIQGRFPMADTYRITDSFLDLVMPRLPEDQRH